MDDTEQLHSDANSRSYEKRRYGGNRERAIQRDGEKCVKCGLTREQHYEVYGRDITVDHIDGRGHNTPLEQKNNNLSNLQTLCLLCHGQKDSIRAHVRVGKNHPLAKLTEESAIYIVEQIGKVTAEALAQMFGIDPVTVRRVQRGQTWSHVTGVPLDKLVDKRRAKRRTERLQQLKKGTVK